MYIEHLIFNVALAVIIGMVLSSRRTGDKHSYSLIIVGSTFIPDITAIFFGAFLWIGFPIPFEYFIPSQNILHSLAGLFGLTILIGLLLLPFGFRFRYSALCGALGYGAHLFEDALTHTNEYRLLWPLSSEHVGIGIFVPYYPDLLGIAQSSVLVAGILVLVLAIGIRTVIEGTDWINEVLQLKIL
jgi:hypothetical protein